LRPAFFAETQFGLALTETRLLSITANHVSPFFRSIRRFQKKQNKTFERHTTPKLCVWLFLLKLHPHSLSALASRGSSFGLVACGRRGHTWTVWLIRSSEFGREAKDDPFTVLPNGDGSKPWYLVNPKIAGKWMFIPLKMYL
jgi:hypothetical protein